VPIITRQVFEQSKGCDEAKISWSPAQLANNGPRVRVEICLPEVFERQLVLLGQQVPSPVTGEALIDSGAATTCVDTDIARALRLPIIGVRKIASASHPEALANMYPVRLRVVDAPMVINAPQCVGAPLKAQGIAALLGRDVLQHCFFAYRGPAGLYTLTI